jgi:hypothetical protein
MALTGGPASTGTGTPLGADQSGGSATTVEAVAERAPAVTPQPVLPLTLGPGGDLLTVAQGSPLDLAQRVAVLVNTPPGWHDRLPDFGLYRQAFLKGGADLAEIERQIATYVPEAATLLDEDLELLDQALDTLGVKVSAR